MRRIQLHLEEELDDALAAKARLEGTSKAALIRSCLRSQVSLSAPSHPDPSDKLIGIYEGEASDSSRVNDVVYDR